MAVEYFLKISGIQGESTDSKHKGEIELEAFSWGETQVPPAGGGGSGGGAGKVQIQDFQVTLRTSKASPKLLLACAKGQHFQEAVMVARKVGGAKHEFLKFRLREVLISSYQTGGSEQADLPIEQLSLSFGKIEIEYRPTKADGSLDTPVTAGWDVKQNKPL